MAKVLVALLVVIFAINAAAASKLGLEEENNLGQSREKCEEELEGMKMEMCRAFLGRPTREIPLDCCEEMREVSEDCRCEALREMAQEIIEGGRAQDEKARKFVRSRASNLLSLCRMRPNYCHIPAGGSMDH